MSDSSIEFIPQFPPDVFAAVSLLLDWSGAYQYLWSWKEDEKAADPLRVLSPEAHRVHSLMAAAFAFAAPFHPKAAQQKTRAKAAAQYFGSRFGKDRYKEADIRRIKAENFQALWAEIVRCRDQPVVPASPPEDTKSFPEWWSAALRLLIIADEACTGMAFHTWPTNDAEDADGNATDQTIVQVTALKSFGVPEGSIAAVRTKSFDTFCSDLVSKDMVVVLPKTRTSQVGCTMRALTHNLAALPPRGRATANWHLSQTRPKVAAPLEGRGEPLNLLLVPFPFRIPAESFVREGKRGFRTQQRWLNPAAQPPDTVPVQEREDAAEKIAEFVIDLCRICARGEMKIHGIVFPEFSLDWRTFDFVSERVAKTKELYLHFEFMIAGVSTNESDIPGNFVAMRGLLPWPDEVRNDPPSRIQWDYAPVRGKHHRWKLTEAQIRRYGLSHKLISEPSDGDDFSLWEDIQIGRRVIDFVEPRSGTSMTTLICEDLARIDPCQEVIRSVGPNLVIALLMDGPQMLTRWPRHYAGVLADDPGSSVLTLTSLGLIERALPTDRTRSRAVAFWKDPTFETELHLPSTAHALAVSLRASRIEETTIDGRSDGGRSFAWRLAQATTVRASRAEPWILGAHKF